MADTHEVVERYFRALEKGDLRAMLECFSEDAVLIQVDCVVHGRRAIAKELVRNLRGVFAPGTYKRVRDSFRVHGELAHLVWHAECLGTHIPHGVTTFVVRDGLITGVTYAVEAQPV